MYVITQNDGSIFLSFKTWIGNPNATFAGISQIECAVKCMQLNCFGFTSSNQQCTIYPITNSCNYLSNYSFIQIFIIDVQYNNVSIDWMSIEFVIEFIN